MSVCVCVCLYNTNAHTKYHVYELRILLNRFKRLKNISVYMCIRVHVYIHPSMITTAATCKCKHIPDGCSNIWMRNYYFTYSSKENESGVVIRVYFDI